MEDRDKNISIWNRLTMVLQNNLPEWHNGLTKFLQEKYDNIVSTKQDNNTCQTIFPVVALFNHFENISCESSKNTCYLVGLLVIIMQFGNFQKLDDQIAIVLNLQTYRVDKKPNPLRVFFLKRFLTHNKKKIQTVILSKLRHL